jgi:hypothetical protein
MEGEEAYRITAKVMEELEPFVKKLNEESRAYCLAPARTFSEIQVNEIRTRQKLEAELARVRAKYGVGTPTPDSVKRSLRELALMDDDSRRGRMMGHPGRPIPAVSDELFKAVWKDYEKTEGRVAYGPGVLEGMFPPGTDIAALGHRCLLLKLVDTLPPDVAPSLRQDGKMPEAALRVAARFPMTWPTVEGSHPFPFDLEAFLEEVRNESR